MAIEHEANRGFYDRISHSYDLIADAGEHEAREVGERLLAPALGERILEIGFGTGTAAASLAQSVGETGRVCGVDISEGMRAVAQRKLDQAGLAPRAELSIGDARELPYASASFDAVFMSFTLELFAPEEIPTVLAEVKRVLRPGGRLVVVSMAKVGEHERESLLEKTYVWMHRHFPHIVDCRPIDVERFVRQAGFGVSETAAMEIWTMPVAAVRCSKAA